MFLIPVAILIAIRDVADVQADANVTDVNSDILSACRHCKCQSRAGEADGNDSSIKCLVHESSFQIAGERCSRSKSALSEIALGGEAFGRFSS
jgi:nitrite reductase/ring-hydroxylating ferredoxin subunit